MAESNKKMKIIHSWSRSFTVVCDGQRRIIAGDPRQVTFRIEHLTTIKQVVARLGGNRAVAQLCDITLPNVSAWSGTLHHIPSKWYCAMIEELHKRGATAPSALWGMKKFRRTP